MHHHHEVENRSLLNPNFLNKSSKTKKKTGYPAPASTSSAAKLQQHQQHTVRLSRVRQYFFLFYYIEAEFQIYFRKVFYDPSGINFIYNVCTYVCLSLSITKSLL